MSLHPGEEKKNTFLLACPRIAVKCPRLALPLNYWDVWFISLPFPTPPLTSGGDWGVQIPAFALQPSFPQGLSFSGTAALRCGALSPAPVTGGQYSWSSAVCAGAPHLPRQARFCGSICALLEEEREELVGTRWGSCVILNPGPLPGPTCVSQRPRASPLQLQRAAQKTAPCLQKGWCGVTS